MDNRKPLLNICSLNCRGLNIKDKVYHLLELLYFHKIDVAFLQETHISSSADHAFLVERLNNYEVFCPLSDTKTKGVCILISKRLESSVCENFTFYENRCVSIELRLKEHSFNLVNIYAPNLASEQIEFIEILHSILMKKKNLILAGDFNCDFRLNDKDKDKKRWCDLLKLFKLKECSFSGQVLSSSLDTWSNGIQSSRIDHLFFERDDLYEIFFEKNFINSLSDHNLLVFSLFSRNRERRKCKYKKDSDWKLNETVLDDNKVDLYIRKKCRDIPKFVEKYSHQWYEYFISDIIKMLKSESRRLSTERKKYINNLFLELDGVSKKETLSDDDKERIIDIKAKISEYFKNMRIGVEKRACEIKNNFINQPTKILVEKEKTKGLRNEVKKFICSDNSVSTDPDVIMNHVSDFYLDLLGKDRVNQEKIRNYKFSIKPIREIDDQINFDRNITFEEAERVVSNMKDAAPGPNGLTLGFFKKYFCLFGSHFVDILNRHEEQLTKTFCQVKIRLIPKNNNEVKSVDDLRPISLTNYEYRIFTKILTNRLSNIAHKIIGDRQTCSIYGRRMTDNLVLLRDLIDNANERGKTLNIVSVDQRKAFDSISHQYLFSLLDHLGVGCFMLDNIKRLYSGSFANISLNGFISDEINIKSGIKQGCALSMILYVIAIEELLIKIDQNKNIRGYKTKVLNDYEIKSSAYADDIVGFNSDESSTEEFFNEFNRWGEVSGASINKKKTKYIRINNLENNYNDDNVKILGVYFSKAGVSDINIINLKEKLNKSIHLWSSAKLNIMERITVAKTFLLSKLWFLANVYYFDDNDIKKINKKIYSFIWNSSIELVKRDTLILPFDKGGLAMFNLKARLETTLFQQFLYLTRNYQRPFFCISVYWMKFHLRYLNLKNFNIIPFGDDRFMPKYYKGMIECVKKFKKIDKDCLINFKKYNSKTSYELLRKEYEIRSSCEKEIINTDWDVCYRRIHNRKLNSNMRSLNYRALNNAMSINMKFSNRLGVKCYLCNNKFETNSHLFVECRTSRLYFEQIRTELEDKELEISKESILMNKELSERDSIIVSLYKYSIWKVRNLRREKRELSERLFICLFRRVMQSVSFD